MSGSHHEEPAPVKQCGNCHVTSTPMWRPERILQILLCNACSIWYRAKGFHRPASLWGRKTEAAPEKQAAPEPSYIRQPSTSPESDDSGRRGTRKRKARDWGADIEVYADSVQEVQAVPDHSDPEAIDEYISELAEKYDQGSSSDHFDGAESLVFLRNGKKARTEAPLPTVDGSVSITVSGGKVGKPRRSSGSRRSAAKQGMACLNCGITETPVWREAGGMFPLCNACGVCQRTNGVPRVPPTEGLLKAPPRSRPRISRIKKARARPTQLASGGQSSGQTASGTTTAGPMPTMAHPTASASVSAATGRMPTVSLPTAAVTMPPIFEVAARAHSIGLADLERAASSQLPTNHGPMHAYSQWSNFLLPSPQQQQHSFLQEAAQMPTVASTGHNEWAASPHKLPQMSEPSPGRAPTPSKYNPIASNKGLHGLLFSKSQFSTGRQIFHIQVDACAPAVGRKA